ncbi:MAG: Asp-tRNA(Asn)/Glu-tRNA(Gln) amidotransferase subunit GatB [Candidatus Marinimicrobia bacterium]|nr:Asp-tRNA(Asn)/Glu-tRNA(Gln) amidotransferase subunit GatB [Candidatus Neomarinimicrobiota bacterium]
MNTIEKINKEWDFVIGIEVHVQLETKSKMFSTCEYTYDQSPNTLTCPTSIGLPGALPSINQKAIDFAIKFGGAVNATVHPSFSFARKHYFYPDLPKGYQISQFDKPIVTGGIVPIWWDNKKYDIELTRAHLEEDAGKSTHNSSKNNSQVDFNRSGAPLIEIVTEPVLTHPIQAKIFIQRIKQIVNYIAISNAEMEQGKLRCDANISLKKKGVKKFGTKTEIKNINSFRNVQKAIESEIKRQHYLLENGKEVVQASLTWNNEKNTAEIMRVKENADDYRYFPDPDLPPVTISESKIDSIKQDLPILPFEFENKWIDKYDFKPDEATTLASTIHIASYFEEIIRYDVTPKNASKWITGELFRLFNEINIPFDKDRVLAKDLAKVISLSDSEKITANSAKEILRKLFISDKSIDSILNDDSYFDNADNTIVDIVNKVLDQNPNEVDRFRNGEEKLLSYFMGKVMKESKGKISHKIIIQELNNKLNKS